jgi:hypothetical protein
VRVALLGPVGLIALAGCTASSGLRWESDLDRALARARGDHRPLYVLSLFGDLTKKC